MVGKSALFVLLLCLLSATLLSTSIVIAEPPALSSNDLDNLFGVGQLQSLARDKSWQRLLQVWDNALSQTTSRVDDQTWFLSEDGKTDTEAELRATLIALLSSQNDPSNDNPQCRFRARYTFLENHLELHAKGLLKQAPCARYFEWRANLDVRKITLVFPAAYLNNPASMFGHTLFRLDSVASQRSALLAYSANFGASTGNDGGVAFALRGLLGGYKAGFSVEPYYDTVTRYGDIEHRDIWEYEILLNDIERERFVDLLWEIQSAYFDYYFFDENCSLYVLALLEYARPEINLLEKLSWWVIPSDTVKVLLSERDLLGVPVYRPSLVTRLENAGNNLQEYEIVLATSIAKGEEQVSAVASLHENSAARILEFSFDYLEFLNSGKNQVDGADRSLATDILVTRSALPKLEARSHPDPDTRPESMHDSARVLVSAGLRENLLFRDLSIRPAYHDVLDPSRGFREGAAIDFFSGSLRYYESEGVVLRNFYPVSIESYTPWGKVFRPYSWDVRVGLEREIIKENTIEGHQLGFLEGSRGVTFKLADIFQISTLLTFRGNYTGSYDRDSYALGLGPKIRTLISPRENLRVAISGSALTYEVGEQHHVYNANIEGQYDLSWPSWHIRFGSGYQRSFGIGASEVFVGLGKYF